MYFLFILYRISSLVISINVKINNSNSCDIRQLKVHNLKSHFLRLLSIRLYQIGFCLIICERFDNLRIFMKEEDEKNL